MCVVGNEVILKRGYVSFVQSWDRHVTNFLYDNVIYQTQT